MRDSPREFALLFQELSRRSISAQKISCISDEAGKFFQAAWRVGQACSNGVKIGASPESLVTAEDRSPSMLEELFELGEWGRDLVIGHALTHAIAVQNPLRYQVFFDFHRLRVIAEKVSPHFVKELDQLCIPVALVMNREPTEKDGALFCRLWSVAARSSQEIIAKMSPAVATDALKSIGSSLPYSTRGDVEVSPTVFSSIWEKSYQAITDNQMLTSLKAPHSASRAHARLMKVSQLIGSERDRCRKVLKVLEKRARKSSRTGVKIMQQFIAAHNYYDARLVGESIM